MNLEVYMGKKRAIIIVIDSMGCGAMPDYADFGDIAECKKWPEETAAWPVSVLWRAESHLWGPVSLCRQTAFCQRPKVSSVLAWGSECLTH